MSSLVSRSSLTEVKLQHTNTMTALNFGIVAGMSINGKAGQGVQTPNKCRR